MNSVFVLKYIQMRMCNMGYNNYDYIPIHTYTAASSLSIKAYNEYYFLVTSPIPSGTKIISDTNSFDDTTSQLGISNLQEFSGNIAITVLSGVIDLEFIKVVPYINFNK